MKRRKRTFLKLKTLTLVNDAKVLNVAKKAIWEKHILVGFAAAALAAALAVRMIAIYDFVARQ